MTTTNSDRDRGAMDVVRRTIRILRRRMSARFLFVLMITVCVIAAVGMAVTARSVDTAPGSAANRWSIEAGTEYNITLVNRTEAGDNGTITTDTNDRTANLSLVIWLPEHGPVLVDQTSFQNGTRTNTTAGIAIRDDSDGANARVYANRTTLWLERGSGEVLARYTFDHGRNRSHVSHVSQVIALSEHELLVVSEPITIGNATVLPMQMVTIAHALDQTTSGFAAFYFLLLGTVIFMIWYELRSG